MSEPSLWEKLEKRAVPSSWRLPPPPRIRFGRSSDVDVAPWKVVLASAMTTGLPSTCRLPGPLIVAPWNVVLPP